MKKLFPITLALVLALSLLAACNGGDDSPEPSDSSPSPAPPTDSPAPPANTPDVSNAPDEAEHFATLVVDRSAGSPLGEEHGLVSRHEFGYTGELTIKLLAQGLTELTGWNFAVASGEVYHSASVDWLHDAQFWVPGVTYIDGDVVQKEEFYIHNHEDLAWALYDSMYQTILENFGGDNREIDVFFSVGYQPIRIFGLELSIDMPYMGSAFYLADMGDRGDEWTDIGMVRIPPSWTYYEVDLGESAPLFFNIYGEGVGGPIRMDVYATTIADPYMIVNEFATRTPFTFDNGKSGYMLEGHMSNQEILVLWLHTEMAAGLRIYNDGDPNVFLDNEELILTIARTLIDVGYQGDW